MHGPLALVADIGGTNARLALATASERELTAVRRLRCADFADLAGLLDHYLRETAGEPGAPPEQAWLALAGPVDADPVQLTNLPWRFSRRALQRHLRLARLELVNDFAALARGTLEVPPDALQTVLTGQSAADQPRLVIGPGTGLGMALLVPHRSGWITLPSEGGHVHFAPTNDIECELLDWFRRRTDRVSVERLLSGDGLLGLYQAHAQQSGERPACDTPAAVSAAAAQGDTTALASIQTFLKILGDVAGDAALTTGARGGVILCGGILPRLPVRIEDSAFGQAFRNKGRLRPFMQDIPVWFAAGDTLGLSGVAALWRQATQ